MTLQRKPVLLVVGILILTVLGFLVWGEGEVDPAEKYLKVEVQRGDVRRTVTSTGTLQAVVTVQVGSQVSGRIQELHADFNSVVKKGQTLAIIDPANFEAQRDRAAASLATAEASVKNAEANLVNRQAELLSSKANLLVARVDHQEAGRQLRRAKGLFEDGLIPERDLETAQAGVDQSAARLQQAEAQISQIKASIRSAAAQKEQVQANVKQAKAELKMAQINLYYTNIISPIDGVVIERNVDIGQTVAASFQAPILFLIANDLAKMQVIAQIDEADIGAISEQAEVGFTVDAFPGQNFQGKISEIRLSSKLPGSSSTGAQQAGGSTNVVVYNVMIDVDNLQLKLRPAMTATVNFTVASAEDVLKVANVALRFQPSDKSPEEIRAMLRDGEPVPGDDSAESRRPDGPAAQADTGGQRGKDPERMQAMRARLAQSGGGRSAGGRGMDPERMRAMRARMARSGGGGPLGGGGRGRPGAGRSRPAGSGAETVIAPSNTTQYGISPGLKIRFPQAEKIRSRTGLLWVLDSEGHPEPRRVRFGITDGRETAVLNGDLEEGEQVVSGELATEVRASSTSSPFGSLFGRRRAPQRSQQRSQRSGGR